MALLYHLEADGNHVGMAGGPEPGVEVEGGCGWSTVDIVCAGKDGDGADGGVLLDGVAGNLPVLMTVLSVVYHKGSHHAPSHGMGNLVGEQESAE